jgi:hypothetical protein
VDIPLVNVTAVGGDGAALPLLTKLVKELGSRTVTIEKIDTYPTLRLDAVRQMAATEAAPPRGPGNRT